MAKRSGGSRFAWFVLGCILGGLGGYFGPDLYDRNRGLIDTVVLRNPPPPPPVDYRPGVWRRTVTLDITYSAQKANGQPWDWPMTAPELELCILEGDQFKKCWKRTDAELSDCQSKFQCTARGIQVPDVPFTVELKEADDLNASDEIGSVLCNVGETCRFDLGSVTVKMVP